MKIWTYNEMKTKVFTDNDLFDEVFISGNEVAGYFNEALSECASEIHDLNKDYFKTKYYVPLVAGTSSYALPFNIYANKIRGIIYQSGSIIYPVVQYRRRFEFQNLAFTDQYGSADDYRYILVNHGPGQAVLEIHPTSRETAILPPSASASTPMVMWYLRNVARVPMIAIGGNAAELCNPELIAPTQISIAANTIQTYAGSSTIGIPQQGVVGGYPGSIAYVTGDIVQVAAGPGGTLPAPLLASTNYYVIAGAAGSIKLATTLALALAGTGIDLTTQGTVYMIMQVGATAAIQNATLIDIPEFATFTMQWVKCRSMGKEDPRLADELATLVAQKKEMVDGLTNAQPDDDDEIEPDFSSYAEMT